MEQSQHNVQAQILRFELAGEHYAFDVLKTREVLTVVKVTPLPNAVSYLSGVVNLRGSIIPVVDLRQKFGLPPTPDTVDTSIIIIEIQSDDETVVIGTIVDAVKGVASFDEKDVEPPPRFGMRLKSSLIQAIAKKDGDFIVILNVDKVFAEDELTEIVGHSEAS